MLVNMVLFIILGIAILVRSPGQNASILAYLMGSGFIFAGLYRLRLYLGLYLTYKRQGNLI